MTEIVGKLTSDDRNDLTDHTVTATFLERVTFGKTETFSPGRRTSKVGAENRFTLTVPDDDGRRGPITIEAIDGAGMVAGSVLVADDGPFEVAIEVDVVAATQVEPVDDLTLGAQITYTGRVIDRTGVGLAPGSLVVIWARRAAENEAAPVAVATTETNGYISGPWVADRYDDAFAIVAGGEPVPIDLDDGHLPQRLILVVDNAPPPPEEHDDCECGEDGPPLVADAVDVVENVDAYVTDLSGCADFSRPDRTVEEVTYQAVVRTTQPLLKAAVPVDRPTIPPVLIDRLTRLAGLAPIFSDRPRDTRPGTDVPSGGGTIPGGTIPGTVVPGTINPGSGTIASGIGLGATAGRPRSIDLPGGRLLDPGATDRATADLDRTDGPTLDEARADHPVGFATDVEESGRTIQEAATEVAARIVPGIDLDGRLVDAVGLRAAAEQVLATRAEQGEPLRLETSVLAELVRQPGGIDANRLLTAERASVVRRFRGAVGLIAAPSTGRYRLDEDQQIDWDEIPDAYQATTIAHGHLLTLKQVWRAAGFSQGDVLYSLPLAPGQQKLVSILDWDRREVASRRATRTETELLEADLDHDRDIADIIRTTLDERMDASSSARTSSVGGGLAGFIGPVVFGAAGGVSRASSTANQVSARSVTGLALNRVRDRTLQAASAVRNQRSTVVQTAQQGESVRAQTEAVANYNHCHSMSIHYSEVMRHLQVSQELAAVQECLFIPFSISPFTAAKALRWEQPLRRALRRRRLGWAFDALERVETDWEDADVPVGRYADEQLTHLEGEFWLSATLPRPADDENDDFVSSNWSAYEGEGLLWDTAEAIFARYLGVALPEDRDRIWDTRIAPGIAQRLIERLHILLKDDQGPSYNLSIDPTLVDSYRQDRPMLVSVRVNSPIPALTRARVDRVVIELDGIANLPAGAEMFVHSGTMRYRTEHFNHPLFSRRRILNDLTLGDPVEVFTPLSTAEKRNPRDRDRRASERLLDHLDEHVEYYHRAIWLTMDPNRRYLLLDGFTAPDAGGRSVASVVENRVIGVVGNSLVMPVAPGVKLDSTYEFADDTPEDLRNLYAADPAPPMRISLPTSGVFAEAVLGDCNSCEVMDDTRFWRWEDAPLPDQPTPISPLSTGSRRTTPPSLAPDSFPDPVVGLQTIPDAPDPTGLNAALKALGTNNIFKDLTGVALNQENAAEALKASLSAAQGFASRAGALAQQQFLNRELDRGLGHIKDAKAKGLISDDQARSLTESVLQGAIGEPRTTSPSPLDDPAVQRAIERLPEAASGSLRVVQPSKSVEVRTGTGSSRPAIDVAVDPAVVPVKQPSNLTCWAAGGLMMDSWRTQSGSTIETFLDGLGGNWRNLFDTDTGLSVSQTRAFAATLGLVEEAPQSYTPEGLARLLADHGPLFEVGDDGIENNQVVHVRIVTAVRGDGTGDGTTVELADSATGSVVTERFTEFDRRHLAVEPVNFGLGILHY